MCLSVGSHSSVLACLGPEIAQGWSDEEVVLALGSPRIRRVTSEAYARAARQSEAADRSHGIRERAALLHSEP